MDAEQQLAGDAKRNRFLFGLLFAWAPCLPFLVSLGRDLAQGARENKATGFGAIAGGLTEWGSIVIIPLGAIAALVLLARSFDRGHSLRAAVAIVSMMWSAMMLCGLGLFWWVLLRHSVAR